MRAEPVDPRDQQWEVESPTYRVYFWRQQEAPARIAQERMGWVSDEWRIADAVDLFEVLDWARDHADGRTFVLYVERVESGELGLIKLAGTDPTESP